jgi:hypothetical protein
MRTVRGSWASLVVVAAGVWVLGGCGGSPPSVDSSDTEATVKGVVKINGTPAKGGELAFNPANYRRKDARERIAKIGDDGTYTVTTLTGENQVRLVGSAADKGGALQYQNRAVNVQPGDNTADFDFKK